MVTARKKIDALVPNHLTARVIDLHKRHLTQLNHNFGSLSKSSDARLRCIQACYASQWITIYCIVVAFVSTLCSMSAAHLRLIMSCDSLLLRNPPHSFPRPLKLKFVTPPSHSQTTAAHVELFSLWQVNSTARTFSPPQPNATTESRENLV